MSGLIFIFIITLVVFALRLATTRAELDGVNDGIRSSGETADAIGNAVVSSLRQACVSTASESGEISWDPLSKGVRLPDGVVGFEIGDDSPREGSRLCIGQLALQLVEVLKCHVVEVGEAGSVQTPGMTAAAERPDWCKGSVIDPAARSCPEKTKTIFLETLLIEGHTDARPIHGGRFRDNLELSAARASAVLRMLRQCQPRLDSLRNAEGQPVVSVTGYADMRLVRPGDPLSEANRRIDLRLIMEPPKPIGEGTANSGAPVSGAGR